MTINQQAQKTEKHPLWLAIAGYIAFFIYLVSPARYDYPAIPISLILVIVAQMMWPNYRPRKDQVLCPTNLSLLLFGFQLIALPIIVIYAGLAQHTLPFLPSKQAINVAMLLNAVAYASFAASFHIFSKRQNEKNKKRVSQIRILHSDQQAETVNNDSIFLWMTIAYGVIGLLGFVLYFGGFAGYWEYVSSPLSRIVVEEALEGTAKGAASTFFRPFLGASIVLIWSLLIERSKLAKSRWKVNLLTALAVFLLIIVNAHYNRGSMFGPIVGIVAVYSARIKRVSLKSFLIIGLTLLVAAILIGSYRYVNLELADFWTVETISQTLQDFDLNEFLQVYGVAPQFTGFLIEQTIGHDFSLYWGKTLFSSLLYPVPIIGEFFRPTSGVVLYNSLIYQGREHIDQIIPFQGELFINFHVLGVVVGYFILGFLTHKVQTAYENAKNAFEMYYWFLIGLWILFLVLGSLAVTSQIFIFFFWPFYIYTIFNILDERLSS